MRNWGDVFSPRQQLLLLTMCKQVREACVCVEEETRDADFAAAVAAYLGLLVGRVADRGSTICRWHNVGEKTENTYARQALSMVWDYSEANPFGGASGDARMHLDYILQVISHAVASSTQPAEVIRGRAQRLPLEDASIDAVITDPPYYDSIPYADLSDFFYVWHKRALMPVFPGLYATATTPKKAEAISEPARFGRDAKRASEFYEEQMHAAFVEAHRVLKPDCPLVVVYAHKTTLGWSTLVDSLRRAGFQVTEAWPLNTEMPDRAGQMNKASLASSIFLAARKRSGGGTGNYATEVRPEMVHIVSERVQELMQVGITGADLVIAAVGAGLRPFTCFDRVELPNGEELPADRFLDEVQREVLDCVLAEVFGMDRAGVGQVDKPSRFYVLGRFQYGLGEVDFGELNVLAQGVGVELAGPASLSDGRAALLAIRGKKARLRDASERGQQTNLGEPGPAGPAPLVDVLHRLIWLFEHERGAVHAFINKSQADPSRLRLVADALKGRALARAGEAGRSDEQKSIDRLLAQWQRLGPSLFA